MVQTTGKYINIGCHLLLCLLCIAFVLKDHGTSAACDRDQRLSVGERCTLADGEIGECIEGENCHVLRQRVQSGALKQKDVCSCGWNTYGESICCPLKAKEPTPTPMTPTPAPVITNRTDVNPSSPRPAVEACRRFEQLVSPSLTPHILGGTPADFGEFPHMAAIGYTQLGGSSNAYDFRCGGSLIEERFVLTAAHCVNSINNQPSIVRLNIVDFTDPEQLKNVIDVGIKEVHIHDDYRGGSKYNDIAILELNQSVPFSLSVRPACLETNLADPPSSQPHFITGWGTINTQTRQTSTILLKAPIRIVPLQNCNDSYIDYGLDRHLASGVLQTQICAHDQNLKKDACQGDSGGPLNLVVDETLSTYRIVGIISAGHSCASSTPGLYTRVAAYLDYIERIVWPGQ